jgi:hypothetical protein
MVTSSRKTLKPLKAADSRLLLSSCVIMWATFASAVGDTKLALTAMLIDLGVATRRKRGYGCRERARVAAEQKKVKDEAKACVGQPAGRLLLEDLGPS